MALVTGDGRWYVGVIDGIHVDMCIQAPVEDTKLQLEMFLALAAPESERL